MALTPKQLKRVVARVRAGRTSAVEEARRYHVSVAEVEQAVAAAGLQIVRSPLDRDLDRLRRQLGMDR